MNVSGHILYNVFDLHFNYESQHAELVHEFTFTLHV